MKIKLSLVVSAFNEENRIGACLESVKGLADELVVVDNSSTDKTSQVAKKYGAKVFTRKNNLMLNVNKNYGFSQAQGEWILNLDADEQLTQALAEEIRQVLSYESSVTDILTQDKKQEIKSADSTEIDGYLIPRKNIIFGKWIQNSIWWPDYQLRLFRNGKGKFDEKHVHELLRVEGEVGTLKAPMQHDNYSNVSQWIQKMDKIYTESEAEHIISSGKKIHWSDAIRFPVGDFLKTFFLQKGYKDGLHGLVLSSLQAFYAEIVFVKVWQRQGFPEVNEKNFLSSVHKEFKKAVAEFGYWFATEEQEQQKSSVKKLYLLVLRKFYKSRT